MEVQVNDTPYAGELSLEKLLLNSVIAYFCAGNIDRKIRCYKHDFKNPDIKFTFYTLDPQYLSLRCDPVEIWARWISFKVDTESRNLIITLRHEASQFDVVANFDSIIKFNSFK